MTVKNKQIVPLLTIELKQLKSTTERREQQTKECLERFLTYDELEAASTQLGGGDRLLEEELHEGSADGAVHDPPGDRSDRADEHHAQRRHANHTERHLHGCFKKNRRLLGHRG